MSRSGQKIIALFAACFGLSCVPANATPFEQLAQECAPNINIRTLGAVIRTESSANPLAIGINSDVQLPSRPVTREEAAKAINWLAINKYNFDIGLGQINIANVKRLKLDINKLLEPCYNLSAVQHVLNNCYDRASTILPQGQEALLAALSCYNTGTFTNGFSNGYVRRVVTQANLPVPAILPTLATDLVQQEAKEAAAPHPTLALPRSNTPSAALPLHEGDADTFDTPDSDTFRVGLDATANSSRH